VGETKNIFETLSKMKIVGYFLALWGLTFLFRGLADITFYVYNYGTAGFSEPFAETLFYIISDLAYLGAGIALGVISVKILRSKTAAAQVAPPPP
jgi:hypothetical protein